MSQQLVNFRKCSFSSHDHIKHILVSTHCFAAGISPTCLDREENERDRDDAGDNTGEVQLQHPCLSEAKLAALCTEVWPVLALIGGVDSGLRAGGLCLHKSSGRRAFLLGVLREGSSLAKLQWEEAELSVRYSILQYSYPHLLKKKNIKVFFLVK